MDPVTIIYLVLGAILCGVAAWAAYWIRRGMAAGPTIQALEARIEELEEQQGRHMAPLPTRDDVREFGAR